jgi:carboxypeptidase Taq
MKHYKKLESLFNELSLLDEIGSILSWDNNVIMPHGASDMRAEQMACLQKIAQEKLLSPEIEELVSTVNIVQLDDWQKANLREMKRVVGLAKAVPVDLMVARSIAASKCEMLWRTARQESDFKKVQPLLTEVVNLTRQCGQAKADYFKLPLYDAMLDAFDPHRKSKDIDIIFDQLIAFLPDFINEVIAKQQSKPDITGHYPIDQQKKLGEFYMKSIGLDFNHIRLDVSTHPFCGGHVGDTRITTRYEENEFLSSFTGILHEVGHALYESNRAGIWQRQPVGNAVGMTIHESQSLFVEMQIVRSHEFIQNLAGQLHNYFPSLSKKVDADALYRNATQVQRSFIRVDADEVTYPIHVIIRYQLEKELFEAGLKVSDIPAAWNEQMHKYLGITPSNDAQGCLQDIHWYSGGFGYFPCYTLGAMTAAQLKAKMAQEIPNYRDLIKENKLQPIANWLKEKIHQYGSYYTPQELTEHATGEKLNAKYFIQHLKERYLLNAEV